MHATVPLPKSEICNLKSEMVTRSHCAYHLGDNLVHLNFLRRVAKANPDRTFTHAARVEHLNQLRDVIVDVPNIELVPIDHDPFYAFGDWSGPAFCKASVNAWRGADEFWYRHIDRNDFVKFHVEHWFPLLAHRLGVDNPIKNAADMLFDYPKLLEPLPVPVLAEPNPTENDAHLLGSIDLRVGGARESTTQPEIISRACNGTDSRGGQSFDVLVINSAPGSGQFHGFDAGALGNIAIAMANKGSRVITTAPVLEYPQPKTPILCTADHSLSVTQIGYLSLHCHTILMVSTGPSWPTWSVWNRDTVKDRIILIDDERIDLAPRTRHCNSILAAAAMLEQSGLL